MKISFIDDRANHLVLFAKVLFFKRSIVVVEFPFCVKPRPSFLIFLGFIPLG